MFQHLLFIDLCSGLCEDLPTKWREREGGREGERERGRDSASNLICASSSNWICCRPLPRLRLRLSSIFIWWQFHFLLTANCNANCWTEPGLKCIKNSAVMKCQKEKNMSLCIGKGELILIAPPSQVQWKALANYWVALNEIDSRIESGLCSPLWHKAARGRRGKGTTDCGWLAARPTAIILTTRNLRWRCGWWRSWRRRRRDVDVNEDVLVLYLLLLFYFLASKLKRQRSKLIKAKQAPLAPLPWQIADAPIAVWLWPKMNDFNA